MNWEEPVAEQEFDGDAVTLAAGADWTLIANLSGERVLAGYRSRIEHYSQAVDAGGDADVSFSLRRNGIPVSPYQNHKRQTAEPWRPDVLNAIKKWVEQGDLIEVYAKNASGTSSYTARARVVVRHYEIKARRS